ncbi:MAG TPA: S41 family peptidase [Planctomycetota bacterium]|nr:S41 family peptidase [Planctomycetota bacterium]
MHAWAPAVCLCVAVCGQTPPAVVSLTPAQGAEVEAGKTTQLVIVFDRAMSQTGWSLCGGGPSFPKVTQTPQWQNTKTLVVAVELEPDHVYSLGLNCQAASNFRGADGTPLVPVPWSFSTLPKQLRPAAEQKRRNQKALAAMSKVLAERYSYYDLRVDDWKGLEKKHAAALLAARTDRGFAAAAAHMLEPTQDLHLYLRCGDQTFATGRRAVDSLFRRQLVDRLVATKPVGPHALAGRTEDGIGYLLVDAWTSEVDPEVIGGAITELADTAALVIDARANAGGDETIAQQVAGWFVTGTRVYAKNRYRDRPGKSGFGPVLDRTITGHGPDRHYDKPIAVLTSRYVMSSNESFVMMLQQARDCTVIGQPTFGSSGNPKPFDLGNEVTIVVPSWQDLRLDGTVIEGEGLAPDVLVPCTDKDLETHDPILEKALEVLRAKVGGGR